MLLGAALVKLTSTGPAFFAQDRLGRNGKRIRIYKMLTMRVDAEASGKQWTGTHDNRIIPVGRFLRTSGIDELPQFLNILRGEMSLIGPRPECPEIVDQIETQIHFYRARLLVLPGLTGWAQLHQGGDESIIDAFNKLLYDLYYIKHQSSLLDLRIFLRTAQMLIHLAKPKPGVHCQDDYSVFTAAERS
jgi:lipopolysaccharide/colanic/teichoic acid biosynthesis glycosyltransferase